MRCDSTRIASTALLVAMAFATPPAATQASSAIVYDSKTNIASWASSYSDVQSAKGAAIQHCLGSGGAECPVSLSCNGGGFGAVYSRRTPKGKKVWGYSCGHATAIDATMGARKECEVSMAIALGALPKSARDAELDWNFVLDRLRNACPGLGNCRCGDQEAAWNDTTAPPGR